MQATGDRVELRPAVGGPAWKALESHYKKVSKLHLRQLFAGDPTRGKNEPQLTHDSSTNNLIRRYRQLKEAHEDHWF